MTALTRNTTFYGHPTGNPTRRSPAKTLRGAHIFVGALCAFHDDGVSSGTRLMPVTDLQNANTPAQGGPLQVAGADANGGLRLFAKVPHVTLIIATTGTTPVVGVTFPTGASAPNVAVACANTTTASEIVQALMANAAARELLQVYYTGNGSGVAGTIGATAVPYYRLAGWAKREYDNSSDASNDLAVAEIIELDTGIGFVDNDTTDAVSADDVGGLVSVLDDQTIQRGQHPLTLKAFLFDWQPAHAGAQGPCIRVP